MAEEAKTEKDKGKGKGKATAAAPSDGEHCQVAKCKQAVRAKGYCRKHFVAWRRGKIGEKHRYNTCSKPECRKPAVAGGRCAEHTKGKAPASGEAAASA
jgi:hypothetical protein